MSHCVAANSFTSEAGTPISIEFVLSHSVPVSRCEHHKFPVIAAMLQLSPEAKVLWAEMHLSVKLLHDLGMGELVC